MLLADDVIRGGTPTRDLVQAYAQAPGSYLSVMEVPAEAARNYGIVAPGETRDSVAGLVKKPAPGTEPSRLASIGRYVLEPDIFEILRTQAPGHGGEIQLADAINTRAVHGRVGAVEMAGHRYDCGSKLGYLEAIVDFALDHDEFGDHFRQLIASRYEQLPAAE